MLSKVTSLLVVVLLIILIVLNCYFTKKQEELTNLKLENIKEEFKKEQEEIGLKPNSSFSKELYPFNVKNNFIIKNYDKKILKDYFTAPRNRVENDIINNLDLYDNFNLSTHGKLNDYHIIGILNLSKKSDEKTEIENNATEYNNILQLYGRQKYPGGREYEYYTFITSGNQNIKIPINNKNKTELYDGDEVYIKELNKYYIVSKYPMEEIVYIPM